MACACGLADLCECDVIRALTSQPGAFIPQGMKPIQRGECREYVHRATVTPMHPRMPPARTVARDAQLRAAIVDLAEYRSRRAAGAR